MAKTQNEIENNNGAPGLGDISVIRNILFGQQSAEFQSSFESFKARMDAKDLEHDERFNRLEANFKQQIEALTKDMHQQVNQLETQLKQTQAQLNDKIATTSKNDKAMIGNLLMEIGKKIAD
jgi:uncharacterized protein (DUF885 family)